MSKPSQKKAAANSDFAELSLINMRIGSLNGTGLSVSGGYPGYRHFSGEDGEAELFVFEAEFRLKKEHGVAVPTQILEDIFAMRGGNDHPATSTVFSK